MHSVDAALQRIYEEAANNTLLLISTAHGDTSLAIQMQSDKARREAGLDRLPCWTEKDEERWATLQNRVVQGLFFAKVKGS